MATTSGNYVCDNSTLANYMNWSQAISNAFATLGWVQSGDTGQVVWTATVLTFTQVTVGASAVYSYSSYTGPAPRVGMSVIITGFVNGTNNVTATLTAVSGGASGTVTVAKVSQVNETHAGSGTTTAISAVPSFTYPYEIWYANDTQAATLPIYIKIGYGVSTSNGALQITVGTGSNGSGTITNILGGYSALTVGNFTNTGASTFPCYFSGDAGEFRMAMWVTKTNTDQLVFVIERCKDNSGNKTADYFTVLLIAQSTSPRQQTCTGTSTSVTSENTTIAIPVGGSNRGTGFFNGTVFATPFIPLLGYVGNPMLGVMACVAGDVTDNTTVTVATLYGSTHTFLATKGGTSTAFQNAAKTSSGGNNSAILMRYE